MTAAAWAASVVVVAVVVVERGGADEECIDGIMLTGRISVPVDDWIWAILLAAPRSSRTRLQLC